jgi:hypothetical protein
MRVMLKQVLDCAPDAVWSALRSPAAFQAVAAPLMRFESLAPGGFPERWDGEHLVRVRLFGLFPVGLQTIGAVPSKRRGARILTDDGGPVSGALALVSGWRHMMAVSPTADGRTLYRDRLEFDAGALTLLVWPALWCFWQYRGARIRAAAATWN